MLCSKLEYSLDSTTRQGQEVKEKLQVSFSHIDVEILNSVLVNGIRQ